MAIEVTFWGVRGSTACSSLQHVKYGGHTSCVSVQCDDALIIFDAGTGLYDLGVWIEKQKIRKADLLLTHFHFDHIIGFPFFSSIWDQDFALTVHYACKTSHPGQLGDFLRHHLFSPPFFPVSFDITEARIKLKDYLVGTSFSLNPHIRVTSAALNHPGEATGYRLEYQEKVISYVTDTEHVPGHTDSQVLALMQQADLVIYDTTYTEKEFAHKTGWGHSTWQEGVRLARLADAKKLALFHHDPGHTDAVLEMIEREARAEWADCFAARQGMSIRL
ncbi:ribonuclease Z [Caedimonas varicaedens]|jgi:phosphoribosyl 1,2-cyclic phosphodiesterase|uniref:Ribonuclease Z n=1 Tax=Caedimonas varicaedens TaxID=1629334 RepID=A0A0K8MEX3_9PROT|nr:ribonuclease Z [Caedimonas varicaedens]